MEFSYTQLKLTLAVGLTCFILTIAKHTALWLLQLMAGIPISEYFVSNTKLEGYSFPFNTVKILLSKSRFKTTETWMNGIASILMPSTKCTIIFLQLVEKCSSKSVCSPLLPVA